MKYGRNGRPGEMEIFEMNEGGRECCGQTWESDRMTEQNFLKFRTKFAMPSRDVSWVADSGLNRVRAKAADIEDSRSLTPGQRKH